MPRMVSRMLYPFLTGAAGADVFTGICFISAEIKFFIYAPQGLTPAT